MSVGQMFFDQMMLGTYNYYLLESKLSKSLPIFGEGMVKVFLKKIMPKMIATRHNHLPVSIPQNFNIAATYSRALRNILIGASGIKPS
jgi:hypothetical protein